MRVFGIIVNPASGAGGNGAVIGRILEALRVRGKAHRMYPTRCEGDGARQAKQALRDGCTAVVCVGGDGTLSEVVGGVAGSGAVLYVIPGGTGNDFARAFGLPDDPVRAFAAQLDGEPVRVDCGSVNGRAFINVAGSGFDVEVLRKTEELKAVYPGKMAYRKAVGEALRHYRALEAELEIDGGAPMRGPATIVEIANGQYIGGGMRVAPGAMLHDGLFDVVIVRRVPRVLIPMLLPLFILGVHVYLPVARVRRARQVTLRAPGMVVNIDGRLERMDEARFAVMPGALNMMRPQRSAQKAAS